MDDDHDVFWTAVFFYCRGQSFHSTFGIFWFDESVFFRGFPWFSHKFMNVVTCAISWALVDYDYFVIWVILIQNRLEAVFISIILSIVESGWHHADGQFLENQMYLMSNFEPIRLILDPFFEHFLLHCIHVWGLEVESGQIPWISDMNRLEFSCIANLLKQLNSFISVQFLQICIDHVQLYLSVLLPIFSWLYLPQISRSALERHSWIRVEGFGVEGGYFLFERDSFLVFF